MPVVNADLLKAYEKTFSDPRYRDTPSERCIYTVALHGLFRELARVFVASARVFGGYRGDIVLFTDEPYDCDLDPRTRVDTEVIGKIKEMGHDLSKYIVCQQNMRLEIARLYDFSPYEKIIYSDVDIMFPNSLDRMFDEIPSEGIRYSLEQIPKSELYYNSVFNRRGVPIDPQELGANSGFVGLDRKAFLPFMSEWRDLFAFERTRNPKVSDQQVFNWLLHDRKTPCSAEPFSDGLVEFPEYYAKHRPDLVGRTSNQSNHVWHFVGICDRNIIRRMNERTQTILMERGYL